MREMHRLGDPPAVLYFGGVSAEGTGPGREGRMHKAAPRVAQPPGRFLRFQVVEAGAPGRSGALVFKRRQAPHSERCRFR